MTIHNLILAIAILLTGLLAGLFYGYDCSVIKGLGNLIVLSDATWYCYKGAYSASFYFLAEATVCRSLWYYCIW